MLIIPPFVEPVWRLVGLNNANDIVLQGESYRKKRGLLGAVHHHVAVVGMTNNASKTKISALIPSEQRQAILLDGEPFKDGEVQVPRAPLR